MCKSPCIGAQCGSFPVAGPLCWEYMSSFFVVFWCVSFASLADWHLQSTLHLIKYCKLWTIALIGIRKKPDQCSLVCLSFWAWDQPHFQVSDIYAWPCVYSLSSERWSWPSFIHLPCDIRISTCLWSQKPLVWNAKIVLIWDPAWLPGLTGSPPLSHRSLSSPQHVIKATDIRESL